MGKLGFSRDTEWSEARDRCDRVPVLVLDLCQPKPFNKKHKSMEIRRDCLWAGSQGDNEVMKGRELMKLLGHRKNEQAHLQTTKE